MASKIILEQGVGDKAGKTGCGTVEGYVGYYNYGNINSYGAGDEIWKSGLEHAKKVGWTNPIVAVNELAYFIKESYIDRGQNTIYSTKYNFDDNGNLHHQYMTNFTGAYTEAKNVCDSYITGGLMDLPHTFVIPVYENMPEKLCQMPDESAYVNENDINARKREMNIAYDEESR